MMRLFLGNIFVVALAWMILGGYIVHEGGMLIVAMIGWFGLFGALSPFVPGWNTPPAKVEFSDLFGLVLGCITAMALVGMLISLAVGVVAELFGLNFELIPK